MARNKTTESIYFIPHINGDQTQTQTSASYLLKERNLSLAGAAQRTELIGSQRPIDAHRTGDAARDTLRLGLASGAAAFAVLLAGGRADSAGTGEALGRAGGDGESEEDGRDGLHFNFGLFWVGLVDVSISQRYFPRRFNCRSYLFKTLSLLCCEELKS